jgi:hypothetical protein
LANQSPELTRLVVMSPRSREYRCCKMPTHDLADVCYGLASPLRAGQSRSATMGPDRLTILYVSQMPASPPRFGAQTRVHGLMTQLAPRADGGDAGRRRVVVNLEFAFLGHCDLRQAPRRGWTETRRLQIKSACATSEARWQLPSDTTPIDPRPTLFVRPKLDRFEGSIRPHEMSKVAIWQLARPVRRTSGAPTEAVNVCDSKVIIYGRRP